MTIAIAVPNLTLAEDEELLVGHLRSRIRKFARINRAKNEYYELKQKIKHLDIAVPPHLRGMLETALGWPGTAVDVPEERLDWLGWTSVDDDDMGLGDVYVDNQLAVESSSAHLDTMITGTDFVTVGRGEESAGEPEVLVTVESSSSATAIWDYRLRRASAALSQTRDEHGAVVMETLFLPNKTVRFERNLRTKRLDVVDVDDHNLDRVLMSRMVNRRRASDVEGRSEITRAVRYYTDAALRTLLGMEINREFYTAPQWYALNAYPEQFGVDPESSKDDRIRAGWAVTMGRMNIVPPNEDGEAETKIQQTTPSPPTPYIEQLKAYSQLLSAETGIPPTYLGFVTDNPASADSIRQHEYRLVKRAERRQKSFGLCWREVGYLALLVRDGAVDPDAFRRIDVKWLDASTPTQAAAADGALKLTSANILPPDSRVTYDRIGLSKQEQEQVTADKRRAALQTFLSQPQAADGTGTQSVEASAAIEEADVMKAKADALGVLVRAGVDPADAARRVGLEGITFTGAIPVALRPPGDQ